MQRAAIERGRAVKIWKEHSRLSHDGKFPCPCDLQINRFRKGQKKMGCGQPRCYMCHGSKLLGIPKIGEILHGIEFREGLQEVARPHGFEPWASEVITLGALPTELRAL